MNYSFAALLVILVNSYTHNATASSWHMAPPASSDPHASDIPMAPAAPPQTIKLPKMRTGFRPEVEQEYETIQDQDTDADMEIDGPESQLEILESVFDRVRREHGLTSLSGEDKKHETNRRQNTHAEMAVDEPEDQTETLESAADRDRKERDLATLATARKFLPDELVMSVPLDYLKICNLTRTDSPFESALKLEKLGLLIKDCPQTLASEPQRMLSPADYKLKQKEAMALVFWLAGDKFESAMAEFDKRNMTSSFAPEFLMDLYMSAGLLYHWAAVNSIGPNRDVSQDHARAMFGQAINNMSRIPTNRFGEKFLGDTQLRVIMRQNLQKIQMWKVL